MSLDEWGMEGLVRFGFYLVAKGEVDATDGRSHCQQPPESEETRSQGPSAEDQGLEVY